MASEQHGRLAWHAWCALHRAARLQYSSAMLSACATSGLSAPSPPPSAAASSGPGPCGGGGGGSAERSGGRWPKALGFLSSPVAAITPATPMLASSSAASQLPTPPLAT
jgi:hypothetical protein